MIDYDNLNLIIDNDLDEDFLNKNYDLFKTDNNDNLIYQYQKVSEKFIIQHLDQLTHNDLRNISTFQNLSLDFIKKNKDILYLDSIARFQKLSKKKLIDLYNEDLINYYFNSSRMHRELFIKENREGIFEDSKGYYLFRGLVTTDRKDLYKNCNYRQKLFLGKEYDSELYRFYLSTFEYLLESKIIDWFYLVKIYIKDINFRDMIYSKGSPSMITASKVKIIRKIYGNRYY